MSNRETVSGTYTLAYLSLHPKTKPVIYKHLGSLVKEHGIELGSIDGTLQEMFDHNMGGGIPYETITALMQELDDLNYPLRPKLDEDILAAVNHAKTFDDDKTQRQAASLKYLPKKIECLFIAEAPPADNRYFYFEESTDHDGLFINIMRGLFKDVSELEINEIRERKKELLKRFQDQSYFLIDALEYRLPSSTPNALRKSLISENLKDIEARLKRLPNHDHFTYFVKRSVFDVLSSKKISNIGYSYGKVLPFPSNGNQARFREELRRALSARKFMWREGDLELTAPKDKL
jgi:hypothetical protein